MVHGLYNMLYILNKYYTVHGKYNKSGMVNLIRIARGKYYSRQVFNMKHMVFGTCDILAATFI